MIRLITEKTELDESIVIKVLDACEEVLAQAVVEKINQHSNKSDLKISKKQCAKIIQFRQEQDIKHRTN